RGPQTLVSAPRRTTSRAADSRMQESVFAFLRIGQRIPLFLGSTRTRRRFFSEATARGRSSEPFEAESRLRRRDEINRLGTCFRTGQARISAETASIRC